MADEIEAQSTDEAGSKIGADTPETNTESEAPDEVLASIAAIGETMNHLDETMSAISDNFTTIQDSIASMLENGAVIRDNEPHDDTDSEESDDLEIDDTPIEDMDFSLDEKKED